MQAVSVIERTALVTIVGCGTVGTAIGKLLKKAGYRISGVCTSTLETARTASSVTGAEHFSDTPWKVTKGARIVFITTPDDLIEQTCTAISEHHGFENGAVVIHCSGALSSEILVSARGCGAAIASLHPLQSFASTEHAANLVPGSFCTIEGDDTALPVVRQIVEDLGGIILEIASENKTLYHAAAVAASNYLVTLIHLALELNAAAGLPRDASAEALLPLIRGTLSNIAEQGIPNALTGPIARGDIETVAAHLEAMERNAPGLLPLYKCLGLYTVNLAKAKKTISRKSADKLVALLDF